MEDVSEKLIVEMATSDISLKLLLSDRIQWMNKQGYFVRGLCGKGDNFEELKRRGLPFDTVPLKREPHLLSDIFSLIHLFVYFKKKKPHIVFTHTPKAGLLGPVAAKLAGVPHVVHVVHGYLIHDQASITQKILGWVMEKHSALWSDVCLSQSREDVYKGVYYRIVSSKRNKYLGNGIDVNAFCPCHDINKKIQLKKRFCIEDDAIVIGYVGRLVKEKGIDELFSVIRNIDLSGNNIQFFFVGPQEYDQSDRITPEEIKSMEDLYNVKFTGYSDNVKDLLLMMDVYILPTYREGVPRALMEACAMEIPCIASNVRGCREVIEDGITGWLVPPKNSRRLQEKIEEVLKLDNATRLKVGRMARNRIKKEFNQWVVFKRFRRICNVLLQKNVSK